jgi:CHAD domain-containing protein
MTADRRGAIPEEMDRFARAQAARLLGKLAFQVRHTAKRPDEEAIHDLRVSIRRLSQCVREFLGFFPKHEAKKILKQLGKLMDLAAEMRNRDIAIELIGKYAGSAFLERLRREREIAKQRLARELVQWRRRDFSRKWRPWIAG